MSIILAAIFLQTAPAEYYSKESFGKDYVLSVSVNDPTENCRHKVNLLYDISFPLVNKQYSRRVFFNFNPVVNYVGGNEVGAIIYPPKNGKVKVIYIFIDGHKELILNKKDVGFQTFQDKIHVELCFGKLNENEYKDVIKRVLKLIEV